MNDDRIIIIVGDGPGNIQKILQRKLLAEEDIALAVFKESDVPDIQELKEPDKLLQFSNDNRAGRRGHRHGTGYWKPQGPANNNNRK